VAGHSYVTVLDLGAGALLLCAVLITWRRDFAALTKLLAVQGAALALIPASLGVHQHDVAVTTVAVGVLVLRALVLPRVVARLLRGEALPRELQPRLNTSASLLVTAALTVFSYAITRPVVVLDPTPATHAVPLAFAVVLIALFVLVTRRRALTQVVGFLMLDNGIAGLAFLATSGVPLLVELGASLDVLLVVLILQVLSGRMRVKFGHTDVDDLQELRD
jgi:hydrogenase-4 component E